MDEMEKGLLQIQVEVTQVVNFALQQNGASIIREVLIKNQTEKDMENLLLRIESGSALFETSEQDIQSLAV